MNRRRIWNIAAVMVMVLDVLVGWVLGIHPQLAAVNTANQARAQVEVQNTVNEALLARLKRDFQSIGDVTKLRDTLRLSVPASGEIPSFVTELNSLASARQVTVKSIAVTDAKPYSPAAQPAPAPGAPANSTPTPITNPKITPANFIVIPVQVSVTGAYSRVLDFVHDLQVGPRLFFVATLSSMASSQGIGVVSTGNRKTGVSSSTVDSTIGGFVYVLLNKGSTGLASNAG